MAIVHRICGSREMVNEEDLKGAVAYLATDLSAYVTGHTLWLIEDGRTGSRSRLAGWHV